MRFPCAIIPFAIGVAVTTVPAIAADPTTQPTSGETPAAKSLDVLLGNSNTAARPLPAATVPSTMPTLGLAPAPPNLPNTGLILREGTYIVDRAGRLSKTPGGTQTQFVFDADGKAMHDPPVILLPNLTLMAVEGAVQSNQRDLHFRISGLVTEYGGKNYVLLDKAVVLPDTPQF